VQFHSEHGEPLRFAEAIGELNATLKSDRSATAG
jgi:hypothetical protein